MERLNYFYKRLKAFDESEVEKPKMTEVKPADPIAATWPKS